MGEVREEASPRGGGVVEGEVRDAASLGGDTSVNRGIIPGVVQNEDRLSEEDVEKKRKTKKMPQATLLLAAEDHAADTIRPRLEALGADLEFVHQLRGIATLVRDEDSEENPLQELEVAMQGIENLALVVIDPISAYLGFTDRLIDSKRTVLSVLADLAERYNVAMVITARLNKAIPTNQALHSLYRVAGSVAFTTAARTIHLITAGHDALTLAPMDEEEIENHPLRLGPPIFSTRIFVPLKLNIANCPSPLTFRIPGLGKIRMLWGKRPACMEGMLTQNDLLHEAILWLHLALDDGPVHSLKLEKQARENCVSKRQLLRAKAVLRVECLKSGYKNSRWYWRLPGDVRPVPVNLKDKWQDELEENAEAWDKLMHQK